jgi:general secretion pathway protein F/type IV pilus assembly protein PilC
MINNGVPILRALAISRDAAGSEALTDAMSDAIDNVRDGQPLAAPLKASGQFDPEIVEMIAVAEESNRMETVLIQIADTLERRTNRQIDHVVRLVEPMVIVLMAVTIAFIALGLLYPVFLLSKALQ